MIIIVYPIRFYLFLLLLLSERFSYLMQVFVKIFTRLLSFHYFKIDLFIDVINVLLIRLLFVIVILLIIKIIIYLNSSHML